MKVGTPRLLFIGALPPPFIGPYLASERLLHSGPLNDAFRVRFLDISDHRNVANVGRFDFCNVWVAVCHTVRFMAELTQFRPAVVYLNISQGLWGYVRDLGFVVPTILTRRKLVLHLRGSEFPEFYRRMTPPARWLTRWVFHHTSCCIVLGERIRQQMTALCPEARLRVIPNGINSYEFAAAAPSTGQHGNGQPRVLFLSSLRKRKGVFEFLAAIPQIRRQFPDATYTIAGEWRREDERARALAFVANNQLQDCVRFAGNVTGQAKVRLYLDQDVFVFTPVEPEGLPWVILEAMSASLPVVSSNQGAIAEVVQHGRTGFIVEPSPEGIAESVNALLANPQVARTMGLLGRKIVEERYSEAGYFEQIAETLLGSVRKASGRQCRCMI